MSQGRSKISSNTCHGPISENEVSRHLWRSFSHRRFLFLFIFKTISNPHVPTSNINSLRNHLSRHKNILFKASSRHQSELVSLFASNDVDNLTHLSVLMCTLSYVALNHHKTVYRFNIPQEQRANEPIIYVGWTVTATCPESLAQTSLATDAQLDTTNWSTLRLVVQLLV